MVQPQLPNRIGNGKRKQWSYLSPTKPLVADPWSGKTWLGLRVRVDETNGDWIELRSNGRQSIVGNVIDQE